MTLTLDREIGDAAVTLEETRGPLAFQDQTGHGIVKFHGLLIAAGTEKQPHATYLGAARLEGGPLFPALVQDRWYSLPAENLNRSWKNAQDSQEVAEEQHSSDDTMDWLANHGRCLSAFQDEWVALVGHDIVAHDPSFLEVMRQVEALGVENPLLVPVPSSQPFIG